MSGSCKIFAARQAAEDAYADRAISKAEQSTPWSADFPPVTTAVMWSDDYKNDPDRLAGKKGDYEAAKRLAEKHVSPEMVQEIKSQYPDAIIVPVVDFETDAKNELPEAFAERISGLTGLTIDENVYKMNKTAHAHAKSALERMVQRAQFAGRVQTGGAYYLIADDFVSLGGTVADLRNYIEQKGGKVIGVTTLGASNDQSLILPPTAENISRLEGIGREGLEELFRDYGIANQLEDLTNSEAGVILRIADRIKGSQADILHGIRNKIDAAIEGENTKKFRANQEIAADEAAIFPLGSQTAGDIEYATSRVYSNTYAALFNQAEQEMADMREEDFSYGIVQENRASRRPAPALSNPA